jgi:hypothetical protein
VKTKIFHETAELWCNNIAWFNSIALMQDYSCGAKLQLSMCEVSESFIQPFGKN